MINAGDKFGRWVVLREAGIPGIKRWYCRCECGNEANVSQQGLLNGTSRSCGCLRRELRSKPRVNHDLTGQRFGRLTVIHRVDDGTANAIWWCKCDCGKERRVYGKNLKSGLTQSCGCLRTDTLKAKRGVDRPTPPSKTKEYMIYKGAKRRCVNPRDISYSRYGGSGVEFRFTDFAQFLADVGPIPSPEHSLDRIDNRGHYEPGNVRWATAEEQNRNKRRCGFCPHDCNACPFGAPPRGSDLVVLK